MIKEEWRKIAELPNYDVSNLGQVRRNKPDSRGRFGGHIMSLKCPHDCVVVGLRNDKNKGFTRSVARLLLTAFIGPDSGRVAHHLDGNIYNNTLENLVWADLHTVAKSMLDRGATARGDRHGARLKPWTVKKGKDHGMAINPDAAVRGEQVWKAKLTEDEVRFIRISDLPTSELSKMLGVNTSNIRHIKRRLTWRHVA